MIRHVFFSITSFSFFAINTFAMPQDTAITADGSRKVSDVTAAEDPHLWLEDVTGDQQLEWVKLRNLKTQTYF